MAITLNGTTGIVSPKVNALDLELDSKNVVERGSNANGDYVRFADGTQICTRGSAVSSATLGQTPFAGVWSFPAAFLVAPILAGSANVNDNADGFFLHISFRLNSSTSVRVVAQKATDPSGSLFVAVTAIGRWY